MKYPVTMVKRVSKNPQRRFDLKGGNSKAFKSQAEDLLLCGPAGTGKTIALLLKLLKFGSDNRGTRMLLCRKTRESLTETGLVTWERDVLGYTHRMLISRPIKRRVRQDYQFANGSSLVVCGLDKPDKALSSDYDIIYMLEATDFTLDDYETLSSRLRTGAAPFQQMICDCNPTRPTHWLYSRLTAGKMTGFNSRHIDNPRFFDRKAPGRTNIGTEEHPNWIPGEWTDEGFRYVQKRLKNMTGARRKRFYEGIWSAAEGLVFDGYRPDIHNLPMGWRPPDHWKRFWSIDWGYNAPLVLQMWAVDDDGTMYLYREIYMTGMRVEVLAKLCRRMVDECDELQPVAVVADHDPEAHATWREHAKLPIENAWKEDKYESIELAQARFDVDDLGRPKIRLRPDARCHGPDAALVDAGKPASTMDELAGYVWNTKNPEKIKEEPVKENDHGCDAMRYAVIYGKRYTAGFDLSMSTGRAADTVHGDIRKESW